MRVKCYRISFKNNDAWYYVDAPNKRIARWCGAACYNQDHAAFLTAKDCIAERFIYKEG